MLKTMVIGHLGKDAVARDVSGKNAINFSIAHSENYTNAKGEKISKTTWVECTYWSEKTGIVPYLTKGTQVYAEGIPEVGTYDNKEGKTIATFKLRVMGVQLLGSSNKEDAAPTATEKQKAKEAIEEGSDDLPF